MNSFSWNRLLFLFVSAVLVGCASPKKIEPTKPLATGDRVGLVVYASPSPVQHHRGTYVVSNFERHHTAINWQLREGIFETVSEKLAAKGLQVIDLNAHHLNAFDVRNLLSLDEDTGNWAVSAGKRAIVAKLKNELNLKAVVTIAEEPTAVLALRNRITSGSGVHSLVTWPLNPSYLPLAPLWWYVYMLDPLQELGTANPSRREFPGYRNNPAFRMTPGGWDNGVEVKNYESITEEEFQKFRAVILRSVGEKGARLADEISIQPPRAP